MDDLPAMHGKLKSLRSEDTLSEILAASRRCCNTDGMPDHHQQKRC